MKELNFQCTQHDLVRRFVNNIYEALSNEIELYMELPIFLDEKRLKPGDDFLQELATALCESVCMIPIFTPVYFSRKSIQCAKEYQAMEKLEQQRLSFLPETEHQYGFIIPIVLRGVSVLPQEIRKRRIFFDFSDYLSIDDKIIRRPAYYRQIQEIAKYIAERYEIFQSIPEHS